MIEVFCDGLAEPRNPGHGCWGWLAKRDGEIIAQEYGYLGSPKTNNEAEYVAIGKALRWLTEQCFEEPIVINSDSQLAVRQIQMIYECNVDRLRLLRDRCQDLPCKLRDVRLAWISSKQNGEADALTRQAYREATGREAPRRH